MHTKLLYFNTKLKHCSPKLGVAVWENGFVMLMALFHSAQDPLPRKQSRMNAAQSGEK